MVSTERGIAAEALFKAVLEREPQERAAFLADAGADDPELRKEVESLLGHLQAARTFLERPPLMDSRTERTEAPAAGPVEASRLCGRRIGSYEILELLAAGGMGVVYLARQDHPPRPVALKLLRPGMATAEMLRRFEHEAEVLGRLQHPGIAQILEAGTTETGYGPQPFFAMELIQGQRLTDYADTHRLTTRRRLELLEKVCEAVHYAHQRGVIHRDLKPANILVDAAGQPKVLDFGVARVTDADLQSATLHTGPGQLLGTIPYMSPEQVAGAAGELDTRSDVYALGVVGYELLTGRLPYDLDQKPLSEAVRVIAEEVPTRLSSVNRIFRGDLETVFGKALEKDKNRRYPSVAALAADLHRYLHDEPIAARPPSTLYQLGKFVRRHKGLTLGLVLTLLSLVAGIIVATAYAVAAKRSQREAEAVTEFLVNMLTASNPDRLGHEVLVKEVIEMASQSLSSRLADQPRVETRLQHVLGLTYAALGEYSKAESHLVRALELRRRYLGDTHEDVAMSLNNLATVLCQKGDYARAEAFYRQALAHARTLYGNEHYRVARSLSNLGTVLQEQGNYPEAEALHRQALDIWSKGGQDGAAQARGLNRLGRLLVIQGDYAEAESLLREALAWQRHWFSEKHPDVAATLDNLGVLLTAQGDHVAAEPLLRQALAIRRELLGEEHPDVAATLDNLGVLLTAQGDHVAAEPLIRQALALRRELLGEEHPDVASSLNDLALLLQAQGGSAEAEVLFRQALAIRRKSLGEGHPAVARSLNDLGLLLEAKGDHAEAEQLFREALAIERLRGAQDRSTSGPIR